MSTYRSDFVAGVAAVAQTYATANPTLLKKVTTARPAGFGDTPHAYVGGRPESIIHTSGTRQRTLSLTLVVVSSEPDTVEVRDRMDDLADALIDAYTAAHSQVPGCLIEPIGVEDIEDQVGTVSYPGFQITIRALVLEGRT